MYRLQKILIVYLCKTFFNIFANFGCELLQNAFGSRALPGPAGRAIALPQTL